jgi:hypothetical protein
VTEEGIENIAIVLPVSRDWDDGILVALDPKILPVPNRVTGDGAMLTAPSFVLPKDVKSVDDAKLFIGRKFGVKVEAVAQMGESYFTHTGVTPQRIYPFMVANPVKHPTGQPFRYAMMKRLWRLIWYSAFRRADQDVLKSMLLLMKSADIDHDLTANSTLAFENKTHGSFQLSTDKVAVEAKEAGYKGAPFRIKSMPATLAPSSFESGEGATGEDDKHDDREVEVEVDVDPDHGAEEAEEKKRARHSFQKPVRTPFAKSVTRRVRKRLMESYSDAKKLLRTPQVPIRIEETPAVSKVDQDISNVGNQIKKLKPTENVYPEPSHKKH